MDVNMSDFDLYILKKYQFIPLLVLCIPILWGFAVQSANRKSANFYDYNPQISTKYCTTLS
jgi:hypothetical protein